MCSHHAMTLCEQFQEESSLWREDHVQRRAALVWGRDCQAEEESWLPLEPIAKACPRRETEAEKHIQVCSLFAPGAAYPLCKEQYVVEPHVSAPCIPYHVTLQS